MRLIKIVFTVFCQLLSVVSNKAWYRLHTRLPAHKREWDMFFPLPPYLLVWCSSAPDTDTISYEMNGKYNPDVYKYCAGYQYDDKTIVGFSLTFQRHGSFWRWFLIMPGRWVRCSWTPGTTADPASVISSFSHLTMKLPRPVITKVKLDEGNITVELTSTARWIVHQYTFPKARCISSSILMSGIL